MDWVSLVILAAVAAAVAELAKKKVLAKEHALEFSAARTIMTGLLTLSLLPIIGGLPSGRVLLFIYGISVVSTVGILYQTKLVRHADLSVSAPLHNIGLVFLVVLSVLWLGERPGPWQLVGVGAILVGTYLLEPQPRREGAWASLRRRWQQRHVRYAVAASALFSVTAVLDKHVISSMLEPATYLFFLWLFIMLNFVVLEVSRFGAMEIVRDMRAHGALIFVVALFAFLSAYLYLQALVQAYVSYVASLKRVSSLLIAVVGGRLFGEPDLGRRAGACLLMVLGAVLVVT